MHDDHNNEENVRLVRFRGIYCAYYRRDGRPVRRSLGTRDLSVAKTRLKEFLHLRKQMEIPQNATVGAILDGYLNSMAPERPSFKRNKGIVAALKGFFGSHLPRHIDRGECLKYIQRCRDLKFQESTILTRINVLRTALNWGRKAGWTMETPVLETPLAPKPRDIWLTSEEAERLIKGAQSPHVKLFIILALHTGARMTAILELTWDRVNKKYINLQNGGDNQKHRAIVPMTQEIWDILAPFREKSMTSYVIEHGGGQVKSIKKGFASAVKRAGLEKKGVTPHVLRHTAATWMVQQGVPLPKVAAYLGHRSVRTTERVYAHHAPDFLTDGSDAISRNLQNVFNSNTGIKT